MKGGEPSPSAADGRQTDAPPDLEHQVAAGAHAAVPRASPAIVELELRIWPPPQGRSLLCALHAEGPIMPTAPTSTLHNGDAREAQSSAPSGRRGTWPRKTRRRNLRMRG